MSDTTHPDKPAAETVTSQPADSSTLGGPLPTASLLDRQLGQYRILERLGQGGMGQVFRALDTALDRTVALKVLVCGPLDDQKQAERFMREARSMARLSHPNLLPVYNVGSDNDCYYFAMELLHGKTLSDAIYHRKHFSIAEFMPYLAQVLSALNYIHQQGITHRDIKGSNIMLCGRRAVLMDFGLAKDASQAGLTSAGSVLGTPDYMSPEAAAGISEGPPTDIYSLGVVMYAALSGVLPFTGRSALAIIRQHIEAPPPPINSKLPGVDPALAAIVHKCLAKNPRERYPDCMTLARELNHVLPDKELAAIAEMPALPVTQPNITVAAAAIGAADVPTVIQESPRRARWPWIAAGFTSVCLFFLVILIMRKPPAHTAPPWHGQRIRIRNADGSPGPVMRLVRFENDPDPEKRVYIIERPQADGRMAVERLTLEDLAGGRPDVILEFLPNETSGGTP